MKKICGVDVSKQGLDARIVEDGVAGPALTAARTPEGIAELAAWCKVQGVELAVMEATGGYERLVFALLWQAGVPCAIANPRQVRRLAEALGLMEKTDRIDAFVIGRFGEVRRLRPQAPASATQAKLAALVGRLRQLTRAKVAETNARRLVDDADVLASSEVVLAALEGQITAIAAKITQLVQADPLWSQLDLAFRQIKGVSDRTIACILAEVPEIGLMDGKQSAKLAGLAPLARDSGQHHGRRSVRGGRASVRSILYVVASVVARYEPDFIDFKDRLRAAGKPPKLIRIAMARKLLVRLNAKARDARRAFDPQIPVAA
jgi:transposase